MMTDAVSPSQYVFREFHLKWHPVEMEEGKPRPPLNMTQLVGYQVERNHDVPFAYRITLNITTHSEQEPLVGYEAHVQIVGTFTVPADWSQEERDWQVRIKGLGHLYGLACRQLELSSQTFPGGRLALPKLDMNDIVQRYEASLCKHAGDDPMEPSAATAPTGKTGKRPRRPASPPGAEPPRRRPRRQQP